MKWSYLVVMMCSLASTNALHAEEVPTKAEQCAQYGSYQDADGVWHVCEDSDMPSESDA